MAHWISSQHKSGSCPCISNPASDTGHRLLYLDSNHVFLLTLERKQYFCTTEDVWLVICLVPFGTPTSESGTIGQHNLSGGWEGCHVGQFHGHVVK